MSKIKKNILSYLHDFTTKVVGEIQQTRERYYNAETVDITQTTIVGGVKISVTIVGPKPKPTNPVNLGIPKLIVLEPAKPKIGQTKSIKSRVDISSCTNAYLRTLAVLRLNSDKHMMFVDILDEVDN